MNKLNKQQTLLNTIQEDVHSVVQTLYHMRDGHPVDKFFGVTSLAVTGLTLLSKWTLSYDAVTRQCEQSELIPFDLVPAVSKLLEQEDPTFRDINMPHHSNYGIRMWPEGYGFAMRGGVCMPPLYLISQNKYEIVEKLKSRIDKSLWPTSVMKLGMNGLNTFDGEPSINLTSLSSEGEIYLGQPDVNSVVSRLRSFTGLGSGCRIIKLTGPSGTGKTTLALNIAKRMVDENSRVLVVMGHTISTHTLDNLIQNLKLFNPDVLIIDDFFASMSTHDYTLLNFLDSLKQLKLKWCILTHMIDEEPKTLSQMGFRPGRIDEDFVLSLPSAELRYQMVDHFQQPTSLSEDLKLRIVQATEGLTGAYVRELVNRVRVSTEPLIEIERFSVHWKKHEDQ